MTRYICLLRAINVSGKRKIKMTELKDLCETAGYTDVETYLQSGNIVLSSKKTPTALSKELSTLICNTFGYTDVDVMVWDAKEIAQAIKKTPYAKTCDTSKLHFTFLEMEAKKDVAKELGTQKFHPDEFSIVDKVVYVHCPEGYGRTKLNNSFFEKKLQLRATTRNWATVHQLLELASQ